MSNRVDNLEHEVKLEAPPEFEMPDLASALAGALGAASVVPKPTALFETIYYDTRDLRLARWGISMRARTGESTGSEQSRWTVKFPEQAEGPALVRREISVDAPARVIPKELTMLVRSYVRSSLLAPVAMLRSERRSYVVREGDADLAVVDDDAVAIIEHGAVAARFREIEVERLDGRDADVATIVRELSKRGAAPSEGSSKLLRALGPGVVGAPEVLVPDVDRRSSLGTVATAALARSLIRLLRHDPGIRLGGDVEDVHQARVATRRLRSDLRTFGHVLDATATAHLRAELGWLGQVLGVNRDADVLLERLRGHAGELAASDARGATGVLRKVEAQRDDARSQVLLAIEGDRYLALIEELIGFARRPPLVAGADEAASDVLVEVIRRQWKKLAKTVAALSKEPSDAELHAVRLRAKRVRYAAEASSPVCGKGAARLGRSLASLQGTLGDLNDAVVAEAWLREFGRRAASGPAFAAGQLVARQRLDQTAARAAWPGAWRKVRDDRKRWPS